MALLIFWIFLLSGGCGFLSLPENWFYKQHLKNMWAVVWMLCLFDLLLCWHEYFLIKSSQTATKTLQQVKYLSVVKSSLDEMYHRPLGKTLRHFPWLDTDKRYDMQNNCVQRKYDRQKTSTLPRYWFLEAGNLSTPSARLVTNLAWYHSEQSQILFSFLSHDEAWYLSSSSNCWSQFLQDIPTVWGKDLFHDCCKEPCITFSPHKVKTMKILSNSILTVIAHLD